MLTLYPALSALKDGANNGGNLLTLSVEAMRARCTVGEVSDALRAVFGEHDGSAALVRGVYGDVLKEDARVQALVQRVQTHTSKPKFTSQNWGKTVTTVALA